MTLATIADIVLGLAVIGWLCIRQLSWTALRSSRMWRLPLLLAAIGVFSLLGTGQRTLTATDLALLLVEAAIALGTGAVMGRATALRPLSAAAVPALRPGEAAPALESRSGWIGVALWAVLLLARIGVGLVAHGLGAVAVESTGVILLTIALNRAALAAVIQTRIGGAPAVIARP